MVMLGMPLLAMTVSLVALMIVITIITNVEKIELFFAMSRESAFASKWVGDHRPRSTAS